MSGFDLHHPSAFTFGILGNIISLMVYLAPLPTFYRIYRKKSTEGFQSLPYVVSLFSSTLWIYYAILKTRDFLLLVTINGFGCFIQIIYIIMFLLFADRSTRKSTGLVLGSLNLIAFGLILVLTLLVTKGESRVHAVGWICVGFSVTVFAAPLSIMRLVIRTKSVEFMPFSLSLFLTLSAVVWFLYGLLTKDFFVAMPNVLGFVFGIGQMILYLCYRKAKRPDAIDHKSADEKTSTDVVINIVNLGSTAVAPIEINLHGSMMHEMKTDG